MPIRSARSGVTLIEMLIVVTLIGLLAGITFPSVSSGLETLRLNEATNGMVSFFNDAMNQVERREEALEITVSKADGSLSMRSTRGGLDRRVELPKGVSIVQVLPPTDDPPETPRKFLLYPGGVVPRIGVEFANAKGVHRVVRVDPMTGVPRIETPETK